MSDSAGNCTQRSILSAALGLGLKERQKPLRKVGSWQVVLAESGKSGKFQTKFLERLNSDVCQYLRT